MRLSQYLKTQFCSKQKKYIQFSEKSNRFDIILASTSAILGVYIGFSINSYTPILLCLVFSILAFIFSKILSINSRFAFMLIIITLFSSYTHLKDDKRIDEKILENIECTVFGEVKQGEKNKLSFFVNDVIFENKKIANRAYCTFYLKDKYDISDIKDGAKLNFDAIMYWPDKPKGAYSFDFDSYLKQNNADLAFYSIKNLKIINIHESFYPVSDISYRIKKNVYENLKKLIGEDNAKFASSLIFSYKSEWKYEERKMFSLLGIAHIFSVSGFHISLIAGILQSILLKLRIKKYIRFYISLCILIIYSYICGFSPATIRALVMYTMMNIAYLSKRHYQSINALAIAAIVVLLVNPFYLKSGSMILSFSATLGIIILYKRIKNTITPKFLYKYTFFSNVLRTIIDALSISLAASIAIIIPSINLFGYINALSIVINMLLVPVIVILCPIILAYVFFSYIPIINIAIATILRPVISAFMYIIKSINIFAIVKLSNFSIVDIVFYILIFIVLIKGIVRLKFYKRALCILSLVIIYICSKVLLYDNAPKYTQLSVGKANCAVLEDDCLSVFDAGESGYELYNYLKTKNKGIDNLFISHFDYDHYGGVYYLLDNDIKINNVYISKNAVISENGDEAQKLIDMLRGDGTLVHEIYEGFNLNTKNAHIECVYPKYDDNLKNRPTNDGSLVLSIDVLGTRVLNTGDITAAYENYAAIDSDILLVAHHGSNTSTRDSFVSNVDPKVALISSNSKKGFPSKKVVKTLNNHNIDIFNTGDVGDIVIIFRDKAYEIK